MAKVVDQIGDFRILKTHDGYTVKNLKGDYNNHGHFDKLKGCYKIISIVQKMQIPKKDYFIEAAIRLTLDDKYQRNLLVKQEKNNNKQYYYNPQKGFRIAR